MEIVQDQLSCTVLLSTWTQGVFSSNWISQVLSTMLLRNVPISLYNFCWLQYASVNMLLEMGCSESYSNVGVVSLVSSRKEYSNDFTCLWYCVASSAAQYCVLLLITISHFWFIFILFLMVISKSFNWCFQATNPPILSMHLNFFLPKCNIITFFPFKWYSNSSQIVFQPAQVLPRLPVAKNNMKTAIY